MKFFGNLQYQLFVAAAFALASSPAHAAGCEDLANFSAPSITITTAAIVADGAFTPHGGKPITNLPAFCRVAATIRPVRDSEIHIEVWMPQSTWNNRIEGTGNGGLAGTISYGALSDGVREGYAVANTDMGMAVPSGSNAGIFIKHPEHWADWGYRSTHEMTTLTKELVLAYYGRSAKRSYFKGCSTGGEQALMEAQRFPDDYDGIVGGAAANNRTGVHESILWDFAMPQRASGSYLSPAKVDLLSRAVVDACDELDGVKDGLIANPLKCQFDPRVLQCKGGNHDNCLTPAQIDTVNKIYLGPVDPRTGQSLYPGLSKGSELAWSSFMHPTDAKSIVPYASVFEWVFGQDWNWRDFDFGHDVDTVNKKLSSALNATNADIDIFRAHKHKILIYHGWSDPLVPPGEAVKYHDAVMERDHGKRSVGSHPQVSLTKLDDSYRLFMIPGMEHCGGGPGPSSFDPLRVIVEWVEQERAPDAITVTKAVPREGGPPLIEQRIVCPYPKEARYRTGDINSASSYICRPIDGALVRANRK